MRSTSRSLLLLLILLLATLPGSIAQQRGAGAWLGVSVQTGENGGDGVSIGVVITRVVRSSPADLAGLRGGDLVLRIDGEVTASAGDLVSRIGAHQPGDWIELLVDRDGHERRLSARLADPEARKKKAQFKTPWAGLTPVGVPRQLREFWGGSEDAGVLIGEVVAGGPADIAGLLPGDLVLAIDGKQVAGPRQLLGRIQQSGVGNEIDLEISRQGTLLTISPRLVDRSERPEES